MKNVFASCMGLLLAWSTDAQILKRPIPDKLVVLTFDDGVKSHYDYVAPLLKKNGFNATFFVCEFPPDFQDTLKYMTWPQIAALSKMGFEIGNHTWHHKHVDKTDSIELRRELDYINNQCRTLKIKTPVSFAYPGYDTYAPAIKTMRGQGIIMARTGGNRAYDPNVDHPFYIPSFSTIGTDTAMIIDALKGAKNGKIVVLTIHGVPDIAHPWVSIPAYVFDYYMAFLKKNQYKVISMNDLQKYVDVRNAITAISVPKEYRLH